MSMPTTDSSILVDPAPVALDASNGKGLDQSLVHGMADQQIDHPLDAPHAIVSNHAISDSAPSSGADGVSDNCLSTDFCLTVNPLDLQRAYRGAEDPHNGAVVMMTGMVRNQTKGREVSHLEYQAYDAMVLRCWQNLADRCQAKYPAIRQVVIHHRLGVVAVGELSVVVAVGCPHRREAFGACQFLIDRLKEEAPIWKKEYWLDGGHGWINCEV